MKLQKGDSLVLATSNEGKIREISSFLEPYGFNILTLKELRIKSPEETGLTFKDNAILKARACAKTTGLPSLADDSGLSVRILGGRPGVLTADWAGPSRNYQHAMQKINDEMMAIHTDPDRRAFFTCHAALCWPGQQKCFSEEGKIEGTIVWPPRGASSIGLEPIFLPLGYAKTFGEMSFEEKQAVSHRHLALHTLIEKMSVER